MYAILISLSFLHTPIVRKFRPVGVGMQSNKSAFCTSMPNQTSIYSAYSILRLFFRLIATPSPLEFRHCRRSYRRLHNRHAQRRQAPSACESHRCHRRIRIQQAYSVQPSSSDPLRFFECVVGFALHAFLTTWLERKRKRDDDNDDVDIGVYEEAADDDDNDNARAHNDCISVAITPHPRQEYARSRSLFVRMCFTMCSTSTIIYRRINVFIRI